MKKGSLILTVITLFMLSIFSGCNKEIQPISQGNGGQVDIESSKKITINGSTSMTKLCNALGEQFMLDNPGTTVEKADTGSGSAVKAVKDGTALIGDLSRNLKGDEQGEDLQTVTIALDGIAVVVNKDNPVEDLTKDNLKKVFTGEISNWLEVGGDDTPITVIGREESSGTREGFETIIDSLGDCKYHAEYPEAGDIVSKISTDKGAIGYASLFSVSGNIKSVKIDGVSATTQNISNGTYPIQRPFNQVFLKNSEDELIKKWFEFVRSDKGRKIIEREKLIAVEVNLK